MLQQILGLVLYCPGQSGLKPLHKAMYLGSQAILQSPRWGEGTAMTPNTSQDV
jgi:hypothetical protein